MQIISTSIPDILIIEPKVFGYSRGYFFESFNLSNLEAAVGKHDWVQDNESKSTKGVLRGLHFQNPPLAQTKLVRCIVGSVLDVAVDIRNGSPTYGHHVAVELSAENKRQLYIPKGFAHGFVVLSEEAIFAYKVDNYYSPAHDNGIIWNDTQLAIDWKLEPGQLLLSEKDKNLKTLANFDSPFTFTL